MTHTRDLHREIPELWAGQAEVLSFADFCRYLTGGAVGPEARALEEAARALVDATEQQLAPREPGVSLPNPRRAR